MERLHCGAVLVTTLFFFLHTGRVVFAFKNYSWDLFILYILIHEYYISLPAAQLGRSDAFQ